VGNLLRNVRDMGRKIGRSMLKMNEREKERKRKAKRYFGEEPDIMDKSGKSREEITGESFHEEVFPEEDEAFFYEEDDEEEGFF